eukprot:3707616-Prymnesium_polylepis.1
MNGFVGRHARKLQKSKCPVGTGRHVSPHQRHASSTHASKMDIQSRDCCHGWLTHAGGCGMCDVEPAHMSVQLSSGIKKP